jgi:hypothetical protein
MTMLVKMKVFSWLSLNGIHLENCVNPVSLMHSGELIKYRWATFFWEFFKSSRRGIEYRFLMFLWFLEEEIISIITNYHQISLHIMDSWCEVFYLFIFCKFLDVFAFFRFWILIMNGAKRWFMLILLWDIYQLNSTWFYYIWHLFYILQLYLNLILSSICISQSDIRSKNWHLFWPIFRVILLTDMSLILFPS